MLSLGYPHHPLRLKEYSRRRNKKNVESEDGKYCEMLSSERDVADTPVNSWQQWLPTHTWPAISIPSWMREGLIKAPVVPEELQAVYCWGTGFTLLWFWWTSRLLPFPSNCELNSHEDECTRSSMKIFANMLSVTAGLCGGSISSHLRGRHACLHLGYTSLHAHQQ